MMEDEANNHDSELFVYTEGAEVPRDLVRARVHPSVTVIPVNAFHYRNKLEEIELCDGLIEIGDDAFYNCKALNM